MRLERGTLGLIPLEDFRDLRDAAYCHLSRKPKAFSDLVVDETLQLVLRYRALLEGYARYPVRRFVEAFDRLKQVAMLLFGGRERDHDHQLHADITPRGIDKRCLRGAFCFGRYLYTPIPPVAKAHGLPDR